MNRKLILLCLVIVLVFSSISSVVLSNGEGSEENAMGNILDTFERIFGFIPKTLEKLWGGDASAIFLAKFLIWVLLFSALFYGLGFVFKEHKGTKIATSFAIATMGAAVIPAKILINMYMTYTVIGSVLVLAIPFLFGWYIIGKLPKEKEYNYIRAFIYILLVFVLFSIRSSISTLAATGADKIGGLDTFDSLLSLFLLVCIIGIISNLFRGVTGRDVGSEHLEVGDGASRAWNWLTTREEEETTDEERRLMRERAEAQRAAAEAAKLRRRLEEGGAPAETVSEVTDIQNRLDKFGKMIVILYGQAEVMKKDAEAMRTPEGDSLLQKVRNRLEAGTNILKMDEDKFQREALAAENELIAIGDEIGKLKKTGLKADELTKITELFADMWRQMNFILGEIVTQQKQTKAVKKKV